MTTCGVCGQQLLPGMGHACSTVGAARPVPISPPRISAPKTWRQLEQMARGLGLHRTLTGCVKVDGPGGGPPLLTITVDNVSDDDADRVVRRALEAALDELRRLR